MGLKIKEFATIRICSPDVARSRDWYRHLFEIEPIEDIENFVSFKINGTCLDIGLADSKSPVSTGGSVGYWLVDNLDQTIARAIELGGSVYRGPLRVEEVNRTIVQIKDPLGNVIGFEASF
jgi:predicted enzyme related to lactoylglutathione lyase